MKKDFIDSVAIRCSWKWTFFEMYDRPFVNVSGVVSLVVKLMAYIVGLIGVISSNNYLILDFEFFNEKIFFYKLNKLIAYIKKKNEYLFIPTFIYFYLLPECFNIYGCIVFFIFYLFG